MASAEELRAGYEQRRQAAMGRLMALAQARNSYMQQQQAKMEAQARRAQEQAANAIHEQNRNWLNMAGQGASMGAAAGPWGALIGGGIGAIAGIAGSAADRGGGFKNTLSAIGHPYGDKFNGASDIPLGGLVAGGLAIGKAIKGAGATQDPRFATEGELTAAALETKDPSLMGSSRGYGNAPVYAPPNAQNQYAETLINPDEADFYEQDANNPLYRSR